MTNHDEIEDDVCFDRLVDGEVDAAEYRRLLAAMDDQPHAWRRLALAFLESQAWNLELGALQQEADPQPVRPAASVHSTTRWVPVCLTAAASFLLAFWLGLFWNTNSTRQEHIPQSADRIPAAGRVSPEPSSASTPQDDVWGHMTLVLDPLDGPAEELELPIFRWRDSQVRPDSLADAMHVPNELRRALEQAGFRVRRDIHWTPIDVEGGSQVFVPLGEVEITPVVNRAY